VADAMIVVEQLFNPRVYRNQEFTQVNVQQWRLLNAIRIGTHLDKGEPAAE
jgi:hypothetical protein